MKSKAMEAGCPSREKDLARFSVEKRPRRSPHLEEEVESRDQPLRVSVCGCEESLEERRESVERGVREKSEIAQDSSFKPWLSVEERERSS